MISISSHVYVYIHYKWFQMNLGNKKKKGTEKDVWLTKYWNISFLATKSVSQLSSITAALVSFCASASKPWAAVRADIFEAKTFPLFLSSFWAASASTTTQLKKRKPFFQGNPWRKKQKVKILPMSQLQSMRAALTSLIGELVLSLNCLIRFMCSEAGASALNLLGKMPNWHCESASSK